ncbi:MAG: hypothetical protein ACFE9R_02215 [Candidatus Hermodarchaeota archaeon]
MAKFKSKNTRLGYMRAKLLIIVGIPPYIERALSEIANFVEELEDIAEVKVIGLWKNNFYAISQNEEKKFILEDSSQNIDHILKTVEIDAIFISFTKRAAQNHLLGKRGLLESLKNQERRHLIKVYLFVAESILSEIEIYSKQLDLLSIKRLGVAITTKELRMMIRKDLADFLTRKINA